MPDLDKVDAVRTLHPRKVYHMLPPAEGAIIV